MAEEPPREFVDFVARHLGTAQREAARLTGGPQHADEIYPMALSDVAGHWRRLCWRSRLARRDAPVEFLSRRLSRRAKQWRDEQVYEVDVRLLPPPAAPVAALPPSYAERLATLLPTTRRTQLRPTAEAAIAWTYAWRRARWHRIVRTAGLVALTLIAFAQALPEVPA